MTNREFFSSLTATHEVTDEMIEFAEAELAKIATADEKNAEKKAAKKAADAPLLEMIRTQILSDNPMPAGDIAAALNMTLDELVSTNKVSWLCRELVKEGAASQSEMSFPKRGKLKVYTIAQ